MPIVNFQVTEINDLSKDGADNKRVVLESRRAMSHTGPVSVAGDPSTFSSSAKVDGCFDLLVDNATQAKYFPMGSVHSFSFSDYVAPVTEKSQPTFVSDEAKSPAYVRGVAPI